MSVTLGNQTYYRTSEVCKILGLSRSTLLRWMSAGIITEAAHRDRRGWRLFTEADIKRIEDEANMVK